MVQDKPLTRIWEIDFFRGIAICLMVTFHLVFDLTYYWRYNLQYLQGFWFYVGKLSAILFTLIAGISATLSAANVRHGALVVFWGMVITAATWLLDSHTYIRFGILHMLGASMMISPLLKRLPPPGLLAAGTVVILAGQVTGRLDGVSGALLPLGVTPPDFTSLDYYPLLPWLGLFCYGMALGGIRYRGRTVRGRQPAWTIPLAAAGRHSLAVYLLHQPLLLAALYLLHAG